LPGRKYDGKRNQIRKFKSEHSYEYERLVGGMLWSVWNLRKPGARSRIAIVWKD